MNPAEAYEQCERITREQARNFSYGIRLLPPPRRRGLSAVYAFARRIDDIGDGDLTREAKLEALENARKDLHGLDQPGDDPVLVGLADAADRFSLPLGAFDELIDGCRADVLGTNYETFGALHHYCRCVAGSIGRLSLAVFGSEEPERDAQTADDLGIALQLTNILRDVLEDRRNGRIYLPAEDLRWFGCTLELDPAGALADDEERLLSLLEYQAARAEEWYARGLRLLPALEPRSRACCAAMAGIYHRLLRRMALRPRLVLRGRTSLPTWEKLAVAAGALAGARR
ncbi:phytoene/squalene synthase family protein [Prauserella muralis]|uniref:Squalene synthase HpnD n=1 Tax=Prauserella muralis TaxID=588067 RepID=A0A2V4B138_9PSEU|nr:squalene/phytoene synthase family protein [Prauserella muralis]PXY22275.1 squalene synthase HpnD [Prauserella muralis]TWE27918.1 farnesyl-diphosphate farnesyltransferase [Prauserella muralis]